MKVAFLGDNAIQFLLSRFKLRAKDCILFEGTYKSTDTDILDSSSELYKFSPDIVVIHESFFTFQENFYIHSDINQENDFSDKQSHRLFNLFTIIKSKLPKVKIVYPLILEYDDGIYGSHSLKVRSSLLYQIKRYNNLLVDFACKEDDFILIHPINYLDKNLNRSNSLLNTADLHFSIEYLDFIAGRIIHILDSLKAIIIKCVVLDLDNTLWGGIIGEDGLNGIKIGGSGEGKFYRRFQLWLKQLKKRGIILAVCSKNDEQIAKEPFLHNPEMVLKLNDISLFIANWDNKADNIKQIKETLNLGYDSFLFLDDNPAEREIVRQRLPSVNVPELPSDMTEALDFLIEQNFFETRSISSNDESRTDQYKAEFERVKAQATYSSIDDYLESLNMTAIVKKFTHEDSERISQLSMRSNQFNLRTVRYSYSDVIELIDSPSYLTYTLRLKDKFGDHGLVAIAVVRLLEPTTVLLENFLMSCRVLKRGVEGFLINKIVRDIAGLGKATLVGEYIRTPKNSLVENFLEDHQFFFDGSKTILDVNKFSDIKNYIHES